MLELFLLRAEDADLLQAAAESLIAVIELNRRLPPDEVRHF